MERGLISNNRVSWAKKTGEWLAFEKRKEPSLPSCQGRTSMRVDTGKFVVFMMGCRRCYLQVDSIFSGNSRTGEMSMSFRLRLLCWVTFSNRAQLPDAESWMSRRSEQQRHWSICNRVTETKDWTSKHWMEARQEGRNSWTWKQRTPAVEYP